MKNGDSLKDDNLKEYFNIIDRCAESGEDFVIQNNDARHAAYLIKTLFKHAKEKVFIFTDQLHKIVYSDLDLIEEAKKFLKKEGTKLTIAFQCKSPENVMAGVFLSSVLSSDTKASITLWDSSKIFTGEVNHFTLIDDKAFRYETNHISREAIANFGDLHNAAALAGISQKIIAKSIKVALPS